MPEDIRNLFWKLHRNCHELISSPNYQFGPSGQPVVVGNELWHIGSMDLVSFSLSGDVRSAGYLSYHVSPARMVTKNTTMPQRNAYGVRVDPGDMPLIDPQEVEWLVELAASALMALPNIAYMEPLASWMTRRDLGIL
jgi:hypothetical protein